ncbi:hypothetical protein [Geodermatophilus sp. URMC 63]
MISYAAYNLVVRKSRQVDRIREELEKLGMGSVVARLPYDESSDPTRSGSCRYAPSNMPASRVWRGVLGFVIFVDVVLLGIVAWDWMMASVDWSSLFTSARSAP